MRKLPNFSGFSKGFYQGLLEKARLTNPTELVSTENVTIQHACINQALLPCKLIETFLAPNL